MFKPVRIAATIILLLSIGLIFVGAFAIGIGVSTALNPSIELWQD